jgi:hypothetical protein
MLSEKAYRLVKAQHFAGETQGERSGWSPERRKGLKTSLFNAAVAAALFFYALASYAAMPCKAYRELLRSQGVTDLPDCTEKPGNVDPPSNGECSCLKGLYTCRYTLTDFEVSDFTHPGMSDFSGRIANDIQVYGVERVHFLQIIGFADGTSDSNGAGHWHKVPEVCRKKVPEETFYDKDLARVRACISHHALQSISKLTLDLLARDIDPADLKEKDFPTSREYKHGKYRKVEVVFTVEGVCQ